MAVNLCSKSDTTNPISAADINHRLGNNATDTLSLTSLDAQNLYFHPNNTQVEMKFSDYKNKTQLITGKYFSTIGHIGNFSGGSLGSMTEKNLNSATNGGWYWNNQSNTAYLQELYWSTQSSATAWAFRPMKNTSGTFTSLATEQGWTVVVLRKAQQGTPFTKPLYRSSNYASFVSSAGTWRWSSALGGMSFMGTSSGLTRHVELI